MTSRSYHQFCGLAYALDLVGERWTLLIIRELVAGPRRFKDLLDGLPGVSTNLLAERLKSLEQHSLVRRRALPAPAGSTVYELTEQGQALEPALLELGRWGSQFVPPSSEDAAVLRLGSYALTLKTFFRPELAEGVDETYAVEIDNEVLQVQIAEGQIQVRQGETRGADAVFRSDMLSFLGLLRGQIQPEAAVAGGLVRVEGDAGALRRFLQICGLAGSPEEGIEKQPQNS
jgi:DNA-binding HxlR family transcriptional regulator